MGYIIGIDVGSYEIKASIFEGSLGRYTFQQYKTHTRYRCIFDRKTRPGGSRAVAQFPKGKDAGLSR